jgi:site-specific recombinase XerD
LDHIKSSPPLLKEFLIYIETIKGKSAKTAEEYFFDLRLFLRFLKQHRGLVPPDALFDEIPFDDVNIELIRTVTLLDLYEYMNFLGSDRSLKARSRARKVASLRSFFKYLNVKAKLIDDDPAKYLDSPQLKKSLPVYLSLNESISLLDVVDGENKERDYAIITLFLNCGMRLSELVGINLKDIREDTIKVTGKGNKERIIYLNEACLSALGQYLSVRPVDGVKDRQALFISRNKKRISGKTVQWLVKKYIVGAGLDPDKYSVHKLRHTAATLMYQYGKVDIRTLQEILGHEQLSTTEIYTHIDDANLRRAAAANPLSTIKQKEPS